MNEQEGEGCLRCMAATCTGQKGHECVHKETPCRQTAARPEAEWGGKYLEVPAAQIEPTTDSTSTAWLARV